MSGWATVTVICNDEDAAAHIAGLFEKVCEEEHDVRVVNDTTVKALDWGYGGTDMSILKRNADCWTKAIVMECNDTTDSGSGAYYVSDGSNVTKEASASGYEGAHGHDAAGKLREEAGFRPYMR